MMTPIPRFMVVLNHLLKLLIGDMGFFDQPQTDDLEHCNFQDHIPSYREDYHSYYRSYDDQRSAVTGHSCNPMRLI